MRLVQAGCEEPTRGLEPLACSLRWIGRVLQGRAESCESRILEGFPFSGLQCVAPYCVPGGVRVVSKSGSRSGPRALRVGDPEQLIYTAPRGSIEWDPNVQACEGGGHQGST